MDNGHGQSISVTVILHALVICDHVDGGIRLSGFILAEFIASKNVDLPYFGGPWTDYQCHSETTSNQQYYQFGVQLLGLHVGPCGFPMQSFVPCRAQSINQSINDLYLKSMQIYM